MAESKLKDLFLKKMEVVIELNSLFIILLVKNLDLLRSVAHVYY